MVSERSGRRGSSGVSGRQALSPGQGIAQRIGSAPRSCSCSAQPARLLSQTATDGVGQGEGGLNCTHVFLTGQGAGPTGFLVRRAFSPVYRWLASPRGHTRWERGELALWPFLRRALIPFRETLPS